MSWYHYHPLCLTIHIPEAPAIAVFSPAPLHEQQRLPPLCSSILHSPLLTSDLGLVYPTTGIDGQSHGHWECVPW